MTGSSRTNLMKASSPDFRYFLRFSMRSSSLPSQIIPDNVRPMPRAAWPLLLLAALAAPAAAEVHATLAAGGALRFDAPSFGAWAAAELWPGGLWGARRDLAPPRRLGARRRRRRPRPAGRRRRRRLRDRARPVPRPARGRD